MEPRNGKVVVVVIQRKKKRKFWHKQQGSLVDLSKMSTIEPRFIGTAFNGYPLITDATLLFPLACFLILTVYNRYDNRIPSKMYL